MIKRQVLFMLFVFIVQIAFNSCSDEVDFSQADDLVVEPLVASSIFYFESTEDLINRGTGAFYTQLFEFNAFSQPLEDRILEGNISYQLQNTTSKPLNVTIEFLNDNGDVLDIENLTIAATPAPNTEVQVSYGLGAKNIDILINTTQIRVTGINQGDNSSTNPIRTKDNFKV